MSWAVRGFWVWASETLLILGLILGLLYGVVYGGLCDVIIVCFDFGCFSGFSDFL